MSAPETSLPITFIPPDAQAGGPDPGIGLCLSGGGYRAMVFHIGAVWRLYEAGVLRSVERVSSVSGGSITAGHLGLCWRDLSFDPGPDRMRQDFVPRFVEPLRALASRTIDRGSILGGIILPGSVSGRLAKAYDEHLFDGATLQDLPSDTEDPRFVINATNLQSGALWRFSRPYMRDWRVGEVSDPTLPLARAVAASSAFPPVLSPAVLDLDPGDFTPGTGADLQREPFTRKVVLSDGGVYDNLGLETVYKRYETILVSDAGGQMRAEGKPKRDWARQAVRVLEVIDNQVRSLRKRQLIAAFRNGERKGCYWGIRTDLSNYPEPDKIPAPLERTTELAGVATRLASMDRETQERLINWGYAVTDAALRSHHDPSLPKGSLPYPGTPI